MSSDLKNAPSVTLVGTETFEEIFMRYYPLVYRLAYRCTGQQDEADDIAQEVFLRYYRMPPRATSEGEQRSWLCRVATNLSLNALRAKQRRTSHEEQVSVQLWQSETDLSTQHDPEQHLLVAEQAGFVRTVLADMPERQQSYLLLRSIGLSYAEIAQTTGVALASVGALLARAEREFRRKYHERVTATQAK